jgi:predicted RNase H-like HicB family nuclease
MSRILDEGGMFLFRYEAIDEEWLEKLRTYQFRKPLEDGLPPMQHWHVNHNKQQALYYIGWVSNSILRTNGEDMYEFAFFVKDQCVRVTAYIFPDTSENKWNPANKLDFDDVSYTGLTREEAETDIQEAITAYLANPRGRRQP